MEERGVTREHLAAAAAKCYAHARANPLVTHHREVDVDDVLNSPLVNDPLTRLMCSGHSDGAAAVVLTTDEHSDAPRIRASASMSGDGSGEWHDRMTTCADRAWEKAGVDPTDLDLVEVHDATSGEEIWAAEAIGVYGFGEAGPAALKGLSAIGGDGVTVNPSGGLVGRGHPVGATGLCQLVEVVTQLRRPGRDPSDRRSTTRCGGQLRRGPRPRPGVGERDRGRSCRRHLRRLALGAAAVVLVVTAVACGTSERLSPVTAPPATFGVGWVTTVVSTPSGDTPTAVFYPALAEAGAAATRRAAPDDEAPSPS